jgi:putative endopeptidase
MKNYYLLIPFISISLLLNSCKQSKSNYKAKIEDALAAHIDSSFSPKKDFFMFANNGWFKKHPIKTTDVGNGIWKTIRDTINMDIKKICINSSKLQAVRGSNAQKIGDFYTSGMDTITIEKLGLQPLKNEFNAIDAIKNLKELTAEVAHLHSIGVRPLFRFYIGSDDKNSSKNAIFLNQGGLGLGQRDYYFNNDSRTKKIRAEYIKHITNMFNLIGVTTSTALTNAETILKMETDLAAVSEKLEDLRDPYKNYNKIAFNKLNKTYPKFLWSDLFQSWKLNKVDSIIIGQPKFFKALGAVLNKYSIANWKVYCKWNLINSSANYLPKKFVDQDFHFYGTILYGVKKQKPRWETIVKNSNSFLGELIGQIYVEKYLPKNTKEKLLEIGENIRKVYAVHIKNLDWMSEPTKKKALSKLAKINMKVGYPNKWKDMSSVTINAKEYIQNVKNVNIWRFNRMINKYGNTVDKTEWSMYPQTYNAYYSSSFNEIVVPACNIMVPGYEGKMPDDAILYGIIGGSTFGHEITHGFDDQGSKYDENGNLNDWWTKEDRNKFEEKTKLIIEQYNNYTVLDSLHINGSATQGENIADLGGLTMGYEAFKKTKQYKNNEMIAGLNPSKRFFLGYALAWMVNNRDEYMARQIMTDVHSPVKFRVNGIVSNLTPFYKTFNVKPGDNMYRNDSIRVKIW